MGFVRAFVGVFFALLYLGALWSVIQSDIEGIQVNWAFAVPLFGIIGIAVVLALILCFVPSPRSTEAEKEEPAPAQPVPSNTAPREGRTIVVLREEKSSPILVVAVVGLLVALIVAVVTLGRRRGE